MVKFSYFFRNEKRLFLANITIVHNFMIQCYYCLSNQTLIRFQMEVLYSISLFLQVISQLYNTFQYLLKTKNYNNSNKKEAYRPLVQ
jgi:hypothetical protein